MDVPPGLGLRSDYDPWALPETRPAHDLPGNAIYIYIYLDLKKGCPVWRSLIVVGWGFQPGDPFEGAGIYAYIDPQSTTPTDRHIWQSQTCRVWESGKRPFKMVICGFEAMPSTELLQP